VQIDFSKTLEELSPLMMGFVGEHECANDLVRAAEEAVRLKRRAVSVPAESTSLVWSWLETSGTEIVARMPAESNTKDTAQNIRRVFKDGARGVQLMCDFSDLEKISEDIANVHNDLFFGKNLFIGLKLDQISPFDWPFVFSCLKKSGADGLGLVRGKGDFAGQMYGLMDCVDLSFLGKFQFIGLNVKDAEDVYRLCSKIHPELVQRIEIFN
jgi:hypothetical protein